MDKNIENATNTIPSIEEMNEKIGLQKKKKPPQEKKKKIKSVCNVLQPSNSNVPTLLEAHELKVKEELANILSELIFHLKCCSKKKCHQWTTF